MLVPEVGNAEARALLAAGDELVAPELARIEVASALIRKGMRKQLSEEDVRHTLGVWFRSLSDGQIVLLPDVDHVTSACELALKLQHSLPDCLYLAAAEHLGVRLVTADRAFARRAGRRSEFIQLLGQ